MTPGRFSSLIAATALFLLAPLPASAAWWQGESNHEEKSGLDLTQGYDRNTVTTVDAVVVSIDSSGDKGPAIAVVEVAGESILLVLGPREYWRKEGVSLAPGDRIEVRGSRAQGADGKIYLMVQSLGHIGSGRTMTLRNSAGRPAWSGGNRPERPRLMPMRPVRSGKGP